MIRHNSSGSFLVLSLLLTGTVCLWSQSKEPTIDQVLNVNSHVGTEFWITIPPNEVIPYPVSALEIYVASEFDTEVEVYDAGADKTIRRQLKAMQVRALSDKTGETNWTWEIRENEQVTRRGIRLRSKKPISVYVINSKTFSSDGYMAIPVSGWGNEYIAAAYYDMREVKRWAGGFVIIASENGTIVDITLRGKGAEVGQTTGGRKITGTPFKVTMDAGDVYLVKGDAETRGVFDLTGSKISSNKPVGLLGFHERTTIPNILINGNGRDHLVEMIRPVSSWGKTYASIEFGRKGNNGIGKGDLFRVIARDANTKWTMKNYDKANGNQIGQDSGVLEKAGEFVDLKHSSTPTTLTTGFSLWKADKPFLLMQYSCSSTWDGDQIFDPFMIGVSPVDQFATRAIFQSPVDPNFTRHFLDLIVKADVNSPDYIDNLKSIEVDGIPVWSHPNAVSPKLLFAHVREGLHFATIDFSTVATAHRITSNGKVSFGGNIYGIGQFDSYGWPIGSLFRPVAPVDTMPPVIKAVESVCGNYTFEATDLRNNPDPPLPFPHDSHQVDLGIAVIDTVSGSNSYNYELVLVTDQAMPRIPSFKKFTYQWKVIDISKNAYCVYYVEDWGSNVTFDTCIYIANTIEFSSPTLNFGKLRPETSKTLELTITNKTASAIVLEEPTFKIGVYFSIARVSFPDSLTIPAMGSRTYSITYRGNRETNDIRSDFDTDTLNIQSNCIKYGFLVKGVTAIPRIEVDDFDAGKVGLEVSTCKPGGLRIANPGSDTLVVNNIVGWENTGFFLSTTFTPRLPISIPPKSFILLKDVCYKNTLDIKENINVTFSNNGAGPDSISNWKYGVSTSVDESDAIVNGITITPNPASGAVRVTWDLSRVYHTICIVDIGGRSVLCLSVGNETSLEFDLSQVAPGRYFINARGPSGVVSSPLTVGK